MRHYFSARLYIKLSVTVLFLGSTNCRRDRMSFILHREQKRLDLPLYININKNIL
jgi:hypothetical protein